MGRKVDWYRGGDRWEGRGGEEGIEWMFDGAVGQRGEDGRKDGRRDEGKMQDSHNPHTIQGDHYHEGMYRERCAIHRTRCG